MNSVCIDMSALGPNIYMYVNGGGGGIYKESLEKYVKAKDYYASSTPSNSWWIKKIEFEEIKSMVGASLSLCEEIC
jgi:hypothetical protein